MLPDDAAASRSGPRRSARRRLSSRSHSRHGGRLPAARRSARWTVLNPAPAADYGPRSPGGRRLGDPQRGRVRPAGRRSTDATDEEIAAFAAADRDAPRRDARGRGAALLPLTGRHRVPAPRSPRPTRPAPAMPSSARSPTAWPEASVKSMPSGRRPLRLEQRAATRHPTSFPRRSRSASSSEKPEAGVVARGADCPDGLAGSANAAVTGLPRLDYRGRQRLRGDDASHDVGPSPVGRARRTVAHVLCDVLDMPPPCPRRRDVAPRSSTRARASRPTSTGCGGGAMSASTGPRTIGRRCGCDLQQGVGATDAGRRAKRTWAAALDERPIGVGMTGSAIRRRAWPGPLAAIDASLASTTPDSLPILGPGLSNAGRARDVTEGTGSASEPSLAIHLGRVLVALALDLDMVSPVPMALASNLLAGGQPGADRPSPAAAARGRLPAGLSEWRSNAEAASKRGLARTRWDRRAIEAGSSDGRGRDGPRLV